MELSERIINEDIILIDKNGEMKKIREELGKMSVWMEEGRIEKIKFMYRKRRNLIWDGINNCKMKKGRSRR